MKASRFLHKKEIKQILEAIQEAEDFTSGEIRLHLENHCESSPIVRAQEIFEIQQMYQTENRNGILIYMAAADKKVAILGDNGINALVPENYWDDQVDVLLDHFKIGNYTTGLITVIRQIGEKLNTYFPYEENDINELSDEISFFDN